MPHLDQTISQQDPAVSPLPDTDDFIVQRGSKNFRVSRLELQKALLQNNSVNELYLKGNETTDGSIRFVVDVTGDNGEIQLRTSGIWAPTGLTISAETLNIGLDLSCSAQGSSLRINSKESGRSEVSIGAEFSDLGAGTAKVPIFGARQNRVVINSNTTGELVTKSVAGAFMGFKNAYRYKFYRKTGSVAATKPVSLEISKGSMPGGEVIFRTVMPASQWFANTEVEIELSGGLNVTPGAPFLSTLFSDEDFSIVGDDANGGHFIALDIQGYFFETLVSMSHGTDRYLFSETAEAIIDNDGNAMVSGKQVEAGDSHSHDIGATTVEV